MLVSKKLNGERKPHEYRVFMICMMPGMIPRRNRPAAAQLKLLHHHKNEVAQLKSIVRTICRNQRNAFVPT